MALEQIIADLDDLEERVENLNVDQKTNEDILLNVLKRVDETEKDLRKVRCEDLWHEAFPCGHFGAMRRPMEYYVWSWMCF